MGAVEMPWKERTTMTMRKEFVSLAVRGEESFSAVCRAYGISRTTGYKWMERAAKGEPMEDQSRAPNAVGNRTPPEIEQLILSARDEHPAWGPRKLKRWLEDRGYTEIPCKSTVGNILKRNGRIEPEATQQHIPLKRFEHKHPNDLWQMDFKGDFGMMDGARCYPLTILDDHSRYSLCLRALKNMRYTEFLPVFMQVLREYGLPRAILCDNGKPWGDSKSAYTEFDVLMMQLGILPIHGRPLHPQTQGKEERFHRTLKDELLRHRPMLNLQDAQNAFDPWREMYNDERPHNALSLDVPARHYRPSSRLLPDSIQEPVFDTGLRIRKVNYKGYISINRHRYYLSEVFAGKYLSLIDISDEILSLHYGIFEIARLNLKELIPVSKRIRFSV